MGDRGKLTTTIDADLIMYIKALAALRGCRVNDLMEEALRDLIDKYAKQGQAVSFMMGSSGGKKSKDKK